MADLDVELDDRSMSYDDRTYEEHASSSDDLLKMKGNGIWGLVERVPLWIKLVAMCAISIFGMLFFAITTTVVFAQNVRSARLVKSASYFLFDFNDYVTTLQNERITSSAYITDRNAFLLNVTLMVNANVDRAYKKLSNKSRYKLLKTQDEREFDEIFELLSNRSTALLAQRSRYMQSSYFNVIENYDVFSAALDDLISAQSRISQLADIGTQGVNFSIFSRIVELLELLMNNGSFAVAFKVVNMEVYTSYTKRRAEYDKLLVVWRQSAKRDTIDKYEALGDFPLIFREVENNIIDQSQSLPKMLTVDAEVSNYVGNTTIFIKAARTVASFQINEVVDTTDEQVRRSTVIIAVFMTLFIIFAIFAVISAVILASSIVGPWIRMNKIQETAISRFVPRGFLKLLGCNRITDLHLGMSVERDLAMVEVGVKDFDTLSQKLKSEELFGMLNSYLSVAGPIIRKFDGFIDRYSGDKFTALFKDTSRGVRACMEIQSAIEQFNLTMKEQYPAIAVGSSIHTDKTLVGAVGENERMDGVILSTQRDVKNTLNKVMIRFNSPLMITQKVLEKCSRFKRMKYRRVGTIKTMHHTTPVFEVLISDQPKEETTATFEDGIKFFEQGLYSKAITCFETVLAKDPSDLIAQVYLSNATSLQTQSRLIAASLQVKDVLAEPKLREAFDQFCQSEHSAENITLWRKIEEEFKPIEDSKERVACAKRLYDEYLSLSGEQTVNINETLKKTVISKIESEEQVDPTLYNAVQRELEILMGTDTLARFKTSDGFKAAFQKTTLSLKVPSVDEL